MKAMSLCGIVVFFLITVSTADAQWTKQMPQRGMVYGTSFDGSDVGNINMVNGNAFLRIPLTSLPAGRAGSSLDIALTYNSAIYDMADRYEPNLSGYFRTSSLQHRTDDWSYGFNYGLQLEMRAVPGYAGSCNWQPGGNSLYGQPLMVSPREDVYFYRLRVILPDGSQHLLYMENPGIGDYGYEDGSEVDGNGWYAYDPGGNRSPCLAKDYSAPAITGMLSYYTKDSTFLRLKIEAGTDWTNQPWTLLFPDGQIVAGRGYSNDSICDRNNNCIWIDRQGSAVTLKDDFNRWIKITNGFSSDKIEQTGAGGGNLEWTIWKSLVPVGFTYPCIKISNDGYGFQSDTCTYPQSFVQAVDRIDLPGYTSNLGYSFGYNDSTGRLTDITFPYGAALKYDYGEPPALPDRAADYPVTKRTLTYQDPDALVNRTERSDYAWLALKGVDTFNGVTNPDGGEERHYSYRPYSYEFFHLSGHTYMVEKPDGSRVEKVWGQKLLNANGDNPYVQVEVQSVAPMGANLGAQPSLAAIKHYENSVNGNVLRLDEYDWVPYSTIPHNIAGIITGLPSGITPFRSTTHKYHVDVGAEYSSGNPDEYWKASAPRLLVSRSETRVKEGGSLKGWSTFEYDDFANTGNLLQELRWSSEKAPSPPSLLGQASAIGITRTYYPGGNLKTETDPNGIVKEFSYGNAAHPYPTGLVEAKGTMDQRNWQFTWDQWTGLQTEEKDLDNGVTISAGYDLRGRQKWLNEAGKRKTYTDYDDSPSNRSVKVRKDLELFDTPTIEVVSTMDNRGNTWKTSGTDDDESTSVETRNYRRTCRMDDSTCSPETRGFTFTLSSNPFRNSAESTMGWVRTRLDKVNRVVEVEHFSGSVKPAPWGNNTASTGKSTISYGTVQNSATAAYEYRRTIKDEAAKIRSLRFDGANRLSGVTEAGVDGTEQGATTTAYTYDAFDNLTGVEQSGQTRTFVYSSLGHLLVASNPESGNLLYGYMGNGVFHSGYDANGNLLVKTDQRGVRIDMSYDSLNRLKTKSYSDGTPTAAYVYGTQRILNSSDCPGGEANYAAGRILAVANSLSSSGFCYDALGRTLRKRQTTAGQGYDVDYSYKPAYVDSIKYPSGRTVSYTPTGRGLTAAAAGYASELTYTASGLLGSMKLGNGILETWGYNDRLQMTALNASKNGVTRISLAYGYPGSGNSGNPEYHTISYPGATGEAAFAWTQSYLYDSHNRLQSVTEGPASRTYGYDAWGNHWVSNWAVFPVGIAPQSNIYDSSNRPTNNADAAGNQIKAGPFTLSYNAENLQNSAVSPANGSASYEYDGEGRRVRKLICSGSSPCTDQTPGVVKTVFVYDAAGTLMAEYSMAAGSGGTEYDTTDVLGSVRLVTDEGGNVKRRYDYLPFGEEIPQGINGRSSKYPPASGSPDGQSQKFVGKERDAETGLDFFLARYYSGAQGRFLSPDEFVGGADDMVAGAEATPPGPLPYADLSNPQSLNKYAYAYNNPLRYTDSDGHCPMCIGAGIGALTGGAVSLISQKWAHPDRPVNWKAVVAGAVGGAVTGATFGLLTAPAAVTTISGATFLHSGVSAEIGAGVISGVIGGVAKRETEAVFSGGDLNAAMGTPGQIAGDGIAGGLAAGFNAEVIRPMVKELSYVGRAVSIGEQKMAQGIKPSPNLPLRQTQLKKLQTGTSAIGSTVVKSFVKREEERYK